MREMSSNERQVPSPLIKGKTLRWEKSEGHSILGKKENI